MDPRRKNDQSERLPAKGTTWRAERTDANHAAFHKLVADLDKDLTVRDGNDHAFFAQFNER